MVEHGSVLTSDSTLRIALLYPELLGTYGDQGNATVLLQRLRWRGIQAELLAVTVDQTVPGQADLYVLGGGEDMEQLAALERLRRSPAFPASVLSGTPVFAVCAGLQLLGETLQVADGTVHPELGLLDASTTRLPRRAVGDVLATLDPELSLPALIGFENHAGRTELGPAARPLASTVRGTGNGTPDRAEGALQDNIVATYLHGPVLAANPALADLLLTRTVGHGLTPIDEPAIDTLRTERLTALDSHLARRQRFRRTWTTRG